VLMILLIRSNGNIDWLMISSIETTNHHCSNFGVQTPHESGFLFVIWINMVRSILCQVIKPAHILHDGLISLFQTKELF
jgi:hypothetical protein